jgi:hypothetical protein
MFQPISLGQAALFTFMWQNYFMIGEVVFLDFQLWGLLRQIVAIKLVIARIKVL